MASQAPITCLKEFQLFFQYNNNNIDIYNHGWKLCLLKMLSDGLFFIYLPSLGNFQIIITVKKNLYK